jgi:ornithine cyclodeaminase
MLYLNADDVHQSLAFEEVMECVEEAFRIYESKDFIMPDRFAMNCGGSNSLLLMPCAAQGHISTKLVTIFPENKSKGKPAISGMVVLKDQNTGEILALMHGGSITALRTGAVTGVSIKYLAENSAGKAGLIGCGLQGYYQLRYACLARPIQRIHLFDIIPEAVVSLSQRLKEQLPEVKIQAMDSVEELVKASDIVISATTARKPVFPNDEELFKGKHFVAIGSFEPDVREFPDAIFRVLKKVWIDTGFAKEESGELIAPLQSGLLKDELSERVKEGIGKGDVSSPPHPLIPPPLGGGAGM